MRGAGAQGEADDAISEAVSRHVSRLRQLARRAAEAIARTDAHRDLRALDLIEAVADLCAEVEAQGAGEADEERVAEGA